MAKGEEHSRRKHRRSGDGGEDSESDSKRRKHHSRSSRHHHHRHRSKHRSDEQEETGDRNVDRPVAVARVDDEMEEGEILEDEDVVEVKGNSEAESGEIKLQEAVEDASSLKSSAEEMLLYGERNASARQDMHVSKEDNPLVERPKGILMHLPTADLLIISQGDNNVLEDSCLDRGSLDETMASRNKETNKSDLAHKKSGSNGISANGSSAVTNKISPSSPHRALPGESSPHFIFGHEDASSDKYDKGRRQEPLNNSPSAHASSGGGCESNKSCLQGNDSRRAGLDVEVAVHEMDVDESLSPIPRDTVSTKHKSRDHYFSKSEHSGYPTSSTEGSDVKISSGSKELKENGSESKKRSLSPESPTDKYGRRIRSPSDVAHGRDKSPSYNLRREKASQSMDNLRDKNFTQVSEMNISKDKDRARHSHYREEKTNLMDLGKSSCRQKLREDYLDSKNHYVDLDKEHGHNRGTSKDRSRNSVSSRHGERDERGDTWDKDLEKDRDRERNKHSSRDRGRERDTERLRHRDRESDRVTVRDRDRESSRHHFRSRDREEDGVKESDRHGSQDRQRDRDKGRNRHDSRERSRELDLARERDKEKSRYSSRGRDGRREMDRNGDRDWEKDQHVVKDRERNGDAPSKKYRFDSSEDRHGRRDKYMDYRHSKYDDMEHGKYGSRTRESAKDPSDVNEHGKDVTTREEDEEEGFQERMALQLEEQEEEDIEKIKEESRKRRQAILEKYKQRQPQQDEKPTNAIENHSDNLSYAEDDAALSHAEDDAAAVPEISSGDRHDSSSLPVAVPAFSVDKLPVQNGTLNSDGPSGEKGLGDGSPKGRGDGLQVDKNGLHDNWDDPEGYYTYRIGEVLDGRYEITAGHGKGVFSTVVRAKDLKAGKGDLEEIAVKIIRNNETMYKAGMEEVNILNKLVGADPEDRRHCVRFLSSFKYRNHLCLVFESLHMNLREVLKKFGRNIGLKLTAVRAYAKQLFIALKHLKNCGVLHCDIKPDNMLVNEAKNVLKLCDFGNAMFAGKNEITPYLVSRFYRAPEIILGLPYDHALDIWSVGCCLYELYTGKVLFPGPSNNDMLRLHMELKGPFPKKMLRKGAFTDHHFDQDLNFHATEEDPVTKKAVKRLLVNIKAKDFSSLISSYPGEDPKMLANFKDLLDRIFVLDPEKRLTVSQALSHPFITGNSASKNMKHGDPQPTIQPKFDELDTADFL
ncbi:Serine/threonine-kinase PRP4-like protein [Nymphaea thermarum]|nr:Serine/threonine-kinase PRP4-like protein [Nymphaea thermarum]